MWKYGWKIIVLLILGALVFLWLIKAPIMSSYLSDKMRVPVSIGKISMWPSQTTMKDFRIKNPHGFKTKTAFEVTKTLVQYQFSQLFGNPSVIDLIELDDIYLSVEFSNPLGTQNNWTAIGANMVKKERKTNQQVLIHKLVLNNLTVDIRGLGLVGAPQTKRIARLEFNEINSQDGFPTQELIKAIFGGAGIQQYIQNLLNPQNLLPDAVKQPLKFFGSENLEIEKE